jgi:GNAT superfamily N-acetyltransferase
LFAYQRETAVEVGATEPERPEEVWLPVRREVMDPAAVYRNYLIAYEHGRPVGGVALVAHDGLSIMLKRCFVHRSERRRGVATALVNTSRRLGDERGTTRLVLDVLASRTGAIAAWRRMGFVAAPPWGDPAMTYFELRTGDGRPPPWLGVPYGEVALRQSDPRWTEVFAHQAELLRRTLADDVVAIEHVGSTAVPGLVAKPIIDVAVLLRPGADIDAPSGRSWASGISSRATRQQRAGCCSSSSTCHANAWSTRIS